MTKKELLKMGYYVRFCNGSEMWQAMHERDGAGIDRQIIANNCLTDQAARDACREHAAPPEPVRFNGKVYMLTDSAGTITTASTTIPRSDGPPLVIDIAEHVAAMQELDLWRAGYRFGETGGVWGWTRLEPADTRAAAVAAAQRHREGR